MTWARTQFAFVQAARGAARAATSLKVVLAKPDHAVAERGIALLEGAGKSLLANDAMEILGSQRLVGARVGLGREALERPRTHQLHAHVDDALVASQHVRV